MATHETFGTCLVPSVLGKSIVTKQLTIESIKKHTIIYVSIFFFGKYIFGKNSNYFSITKFFNVKNTQNVFLSTMAYILPDKNNQKYSSLPHKAAHDAVGYEYAIVGKTEVITGDFQ